MRSRDLGGAHAPTAPAWLRLCTLYIITRIPSVYLATGKTYVRVIAGPAGPVGEKDLPGMQATTGYVQLG